MRCATGIALMVVACAATAEARSPVLNFEQVKAASPLQAGTTALAGVGVAYVPANIGGPAPLLLLFHGAGMTAGEFLDGMKQEGDRCGCVLLAVQSRGLTWDLSLSLAKARRKEAPAFEFGEDANRVERGLAELLSRVPIDRSQIVPVGFSDGASYGLSLAIANPRLFRTSVAIAPGFVVRPARIDLSQRLFIAHGKADPVLPYQAARAAVARPLEQLGFSIRFKPFEGGHLIDRQSLRDGIDFAIGPKG